MKNILIFVLILSILSSCADSKNLLVDGQLTTIEPYGWANKNAMKVDGVVYQVNAGNVVLSIIFCETLLVPIILTGWYLFEPVRLEKNL